MTIYDHRAAPPTEHWTATECVTIGDTCYPLANLPPGLYLAGPDDPVPAGYRAAAWTRVVRDGLSVNVPTLEAISLADVKAARIAEIAAESARRVEARWPADERVASVAGEPLTPANPTAAADAWAHIVARDAAVARVEAATDATGVAAVTVEWPT